MTPASHLRQCAALVVAASGWLIVASGCSNDPPDYLGSNNQWSTPVEDTSGSERDDTDTSSDATDGDTTDQTGGDPPADAGESDAGDTGESDAGDTGESDAGDTGESDTGDTGESDAGGDDQDCEGLECDQVACDPGEPTSVSGTVTIPSGELSLPGVAVYVPSPDTLEEPAKGASCERCEDHLSGDPFVSTTTDLAGSFKLTDVPVVDELTVVVEIGKWRRTLTVTDLDPCADNSLDSDRTRLPNNTDEGHLPRIAVTTGGWDAIECLIRKIGVDDEEFTTEDGDGAVHLFSGVEGTDEFDDALNDGAEFTEATEWWDDVDNLLDYDIVVHNCEGSPNHQTKPQQARQALQEFTHAGGRVFLSHWQNIWLEEGPAGFEDVADWTADGLIDENQTGQIDTTFPKGELFEDWMVETGDTPQGQFPVQEARATVGELDETLARQWVYAVEDSIFGTEHHPQLFSFNTPVEPGDADQCGRVVFSDIHVAPEENSSPDDPFPTGCTDMTNDQERALIFSFFDLSRCIVDDDSPYPTD